MAIFHTRKPLLLMNLRKFLTAYTKSSSLIITIQENKMITASEQRWLILIWLIINWFQLVIISIKMDRNKNRNKGDTDAET